MEYKALLIFCFILLYRDSKGASCPHGWTSHAFSCYVFIEDLLIDFTESTSFCNRIQGKLVEIESEDENNFIRNYLLHNTTHTQNFWIGGTDAVFENEWRWMSTLEKMGFTDWSPTQPDNYMSHQDCAMFFLSDNYHWNDHYCDVKAGYICEREIEEGSSVIG
ncbi:Hypothetical predicted protein [Mytilus galloprovincialis]|uniref:C-type lectin domain-containing protein n=2 Tax=Mytilus galloprovincialis TaxID=29158 RepID=A0A8B6BEV3_MYTGA|nr:Hypothetical predicted protein [Mytilus galloprovincialis]